MAHLAAYIKTSFDLAQFSDFQIITSDKTIYLSSFILKSNIYFKTFFDSNLSSDKTKMDMSTYSSSTPQKLAWYIYSGEFEIDPATTEPDDFFDLVNLTRSWQLVELLHMELRYLYAKWKSILEQDIGYASTLHLHFRDHPKIEWKYKKNYGEVYHEYTQYWSGKELMECVSKFLTENKKQISAELIGTDLFEKLPECVQTDVLVRFGKYEKIPLSIKYLHHFSEAFQKYYKPESKIFTLKQISLLKGEINIGGPDYLPIIANRTVSLKSLIPFRATLYTYIGEVVKSDHSGMLKINVVGTLKKSSCLYAEGESFEIVKLSWNGDEIDEALSGETYSITLKNCPKPLKSETPLFIMETIV